MEDGNLLSRLSKYTKIVAQNEVVIIDYGMGNIWSVASAIQHLNYSPVISTETSVIASAKRLVLPGVGSFRQAMQTIRQNSIDQAIHSALENSNTKLLGICLGMQLLGISSTEDGVTQGLGLVKNEVTKLSVATKRNLKIPHVGFAKLKRANDLILLDKIESNASFYFVHSYAMRQLDHNAKYATCVHGEEFVAVLESDQVFGTQFHPEKSQKNGLKLLNNFLLQ